MRGGWAAGVFAGGVAVQLKDNQTGLAVCLRLAAASVLSRPFSPRPAGPVLPLSRLCRYLENVPTIVPVLEKEYRNASRRLEETQVELNDLHPEKLKVGGWMDVWVDGWLGGSWAGRWVGN